MIEMDGVNGWHQIYDNDLKPIVEEILALEDKLLDRRPSSIFKKIDLEGGGDELVNLLIKLEGYDFYKSYPNVHKDALDGLSEFLFLHTEYTEALIHIIRNLSNKAKGMEYSASAYRVDIKEVDLAREKAGKYHDQMILKLINMSYKL